ncbi:hypothetical protein ACTXJO_04510 [Psychrobacter celer]|uniref:hypothetical protein n=1 Tax=Psychrobacter celer TaxID=306572 RepID=UPI003FD34FFA
MTLAQDMETLARAGDRYNKCVDCGNAYHVNTPDGFLISGYKRCISCQWLKSNNQSAKEVVRCASTAKPYVKRDRSTAEQVWIRQIWMDKNGVRQVTLGSSVNQGVTVMKLADFYLRYELDQSRESDQKKIAPLASHENIYYYVTYSFLVGRRKEYKRGVIVISAKGLSIFNLSVLQKRIKNKEQKQTRLKVHGVLIENWVKINEAEHNDLMAGR